MNIHLFNDLLAAGVGLQGLHLAYFILVSLGILAVGCTTNQVVEG